MRPAGSKNEVTVDALESGGGGKDGATIDDSARPDVSVLGVPLRPGVDCNDLLATCNLQAALRKGNRMERKAMDLIQQ